MLPIPSKRRRTDMVVTNPVPQTSPLPAVPSSQLPVTGQTAAMTSSALQQYHLRAAATAPAAPIGVSAIDMKSRTKSAPDVQVAGLLLSKGSASAAATTNQGLSPRANNETHKQLQMLALEVEPVVIRRSTSQSLSSSASADVGTTSPPAANGLFCPQNQSSNNSSRNNPSAIIGYRPTYRAVLAKRGYLVKNTLGSGSYSKVKKVYYFTKHSIMQQAAVKIIDRQKAPQDYQDKFLPRELKHWPRLRHPNLVALIDCFQDSQRVYMVLEYADGGDALKYIQSNGAITEELARNWTGQITSAVGYMHKLDIAHRDLKLENLLIDTGGHNIKLCDFGFVREANAGDFSQTYCGSKSYAAPEILKGRPYDPKKADVWAVGVILYIFVTGKMPFDETKGTRHILEEQKSLDFHWSRTRIISTSCQNLVRRMFTWEFSNRPTVYDVMSDGWFMPRLQQPAQQQAQPNSKTTTSSDNRTTDNTNGRRTTSPVATVQNFTGLNGTPSPSLQPRASALAKTQSNSLTTGSGDKSNLPGAQICLLPPSTQAGRGLLSIHSTVQNARLVAPSGVLPVQNAHVGSR